MDVVMALQWDVVVGWRWKSKYMGKYKTRKVVEEEVMSVESVQEMMSRRRVCSCSEESSRS